MPTAEIILDGTMAHQVNYVFSQCSLMAVLHLLSAKLIILYHIATKKCAIRLATRTSIFAVSVQGAKYDNIALQCKYEKKIQNG